MLWLDRSFGKLYVKLQAGDSVSSITLRTTHALAVALNCRSCSSRSSTTLHMRCASPAGVAKPIIPCSSMGLAARMEMRTSSVLMIGSHLGAEASASLLLCRPWPPQLAHHSHPQRPTPAIGTLICLHDADGKTITSPTCMQGWAAPAVTLQRGCCHGCCRPRCHQCHSPRPVPQSHAQLPAAGRLSGS